MKIHLSHFTQIQISKTNFESKLINNLRKLILYTLFIASKILLREPYLAVKLDVYGLEVTRASM